LSLCGFSARIQNFRPIGSHARTSLRAGRTSTRSEE
jgi:hypothetical protein